MAIFKSPFISIVLALASLACVGVVAAGSIQSEAGLAKMLAGRVAGQPVDCVTLTNLGGSRIIEGTAIVYEGNGGTLYVNRPSGATFLREDDILVTHPHGSQLCRMDFVDLLDRSVHMPRGSISMGKFVPYQKPPQP